MQTKKNTSAKLVCGALLASVCAASAATTASANYVDIDVFTAAYDGTTQLYSVLQGVHTFGGAATVIGAGNYTATVTSGASADAAWDFEVSIDYTAYDAGFFLVYGINYLYLALDNITQGGGPQVGDFVMVNGAGTVLDIDGGAVIGGTDGDNIWGAVLISDVLAGNDTLIVRWNAIPAPGAFALLGMAGLVGARRRRD